MCDPSIFIFEFAKKCQPKLNCIPICQKISTQIIIIYFKANIHKIYYSYIVNVRVRTIVWL